MMELRDTLGRCGTKPFEGYGDLSLTELLPAILTRYSETRLLIAAPSLPEQATDVIERWMGRQWARNDGKGRIDAVAALVIVTDTDPERSPAVARWMERSPFGERLSICPSLVTDTAILLPDFAVTGPVNMRYGEHFVAEATTEAEKVSALWARYMPAPPAAEEPDPALTEQETAALPEEGREEAPEEQRPRPKGKTQRQKKDAE